MNASDVLAKLTSLADPKVAQHSARFFKSGPGEYAEGDRFLGIRVPDQRKIAARFKKLPLPEVKKLLYSEFHEARLTSLFILEYAFRKADDAGKTEIAEFYLMHRGQVNNWDLVDSSAYKILGPYLENKDRIILYELAQSEKLWDRRIAIITTMHFVKKSDFKDAFAIADLLMNDDHDLIHKATGWIIRESGKLDRQAMEKFLLPRCQNMPRTMLRYAIEHLPEERRKAYLEGKAE